MKKLKTVLAALLVSLTLAVAAQAAVITFDEVPLGSTDPTVYGASFWAGDGSLLQDTYIDDYWTPGNAYLASGRDDLTGKSPGLFDTFIGVSLAAGTTGVSFDILSEEVLPGGTTLWLQAYGGGSLKGSTSIFVEDSSYFTMALNAGSAIDTLFIFDELNSFGLGEAFHIDNFDATFDANPSIPEPSTLVLMASGLAAALAWRKRQAKRQL